MAVVFCSVVWDFSRPLNPRLILNTVQTHGSEVRMKTEKGREADSKRAVSSPNIKTPARWRSCLSFFLVSFEGVFIWPVHNLYFFSFSLPMHKESGAVKFNMRGWNDQKPSTAWATVAPGAEREMNNLQSTETKKHRQAANSFHSSCPRNEKTIFFSFKIFHRIIL